MLEMETANASKTILRGDAAPGVWRFAEATRARVIVDAADYFEAVRAAMLKAQHRIMLIGWDFDTRIDLGKARRKKGDPPKRLGDFLIWLADRNPDLEVRILKWNFGALKMFGRGSTIIDVARWAMHKGIQFKLDSAHPFGCSHHQKLVVIDDAFAVCGGIDMTNDRWDTREHLDDHPGRKEPNGKPYGPWHDITMLMEGPVAGALAELARDRWVTAGGEALAPCPMATESAWPEFVEADYHDVTLGIARTRAAYQDADEIREIETLFLEQIKRAKFFIYAENQYFASRKISEAIAKRMAEPNPPEIIIVNPANADGWLEQKAMDSARVQLLRSIGAHDPQDRFSIFIPYTEGGTPIYVHAKLTIIDDEIVRVGSANMNNRSLGLDSECDVFIDAKIEGNATAKAQITALRLSLLAEHCGVSSEDMAKRLEVHGSMRAAIEATRDSGRNLIRLDLPELTDAERAIADNQALDPESAEEMFEPFASKSLFKRSRILNKPD
jgi:phosphatidylserine/phosphatidylglycerophosphate/cardiolipin synthase-like enzyme